MRRAASSPVSKTWAAGSRSTISAPDTRHSATSAAGRGYRQDRRQLRQESWRPRRRPGLRAHGHRTRAATRPEDSRRMGAGRSRRRDAGGWGCDYLQGALFGEASVAPPWSGHEPDRGCAVGQRSSETRVKSGRPISRRTSILSCIASRCVSKDTHDVTHGSRRAAHPKSLCDLRVSGPAGAPHHEVLHFGDRAARRVHPPRRLSRNTACSPNRFQNHHGALSRNGRPQASSASAPLHLGADRPAQVAEVLDGAEVDVGRVVPGVRQVVGSRHAAAEQQLQPDPPMAEIGERHHRVAADPQHVLEHQRGDGGSPAGSATGSRNRRHRPDSRRGRRRRRPGSPRAPWRRSR